MTTTYRVILEDGEYWAVEYENGAKLRHLAITELDAQFLTEDELECLFDGSGTDPANGYQYEYKGQS